MHNTHIRMATRFLVSSVVPHLAEDIKSKKEIFKQSVSSFVHKAGVNIRHMGLLRYLLREEADKVGELARALVADPLMLRLAFEELHVRDGALEEEFPVGLVLVRVDEDSQVLVSLYSRSM